MERIGTYITALLVLAFLAIPVWGLCFFSIKDTMNMVPLGDNVELIEASKIYDDGTLKYDCKIKYVYNNQTYESNIEIDEYSLSGDVIELFIRKDNPMDVCDLSFYKFERNLSYFLLGLSIIFILFALKSIFNIISGIILEIFGLKVGLKTKHYTCLIEDFYYSEKHSSDVVKCKGTMDDSLEERTFEVPYNYEYEIIDSNFLIGEWLDVYVNDKKKIVYGDFKKFFKELHLEEFKSHFKFF